MMHRLKHPDSFLQRMSRQQSYRVPTEYALIKLAPPPLHDVMYGRKQDMLQQRGLSLTYDLKRLKDPEITDEWLDGLLEAARILQLTETEWYFVEDGDKGPYSPRNEIEALRALELTARGRRSAGEVAETISGTLLSTVHDLVLGRLNACARDTSAVRKGAVGDAETKLSSWAAKQGIKSIIHPARFEGTGRGGSASRDIDTGDLVLEIPQNALIREDMALESNMGLAFKETSGLSGETMSLLWSMRERRNEKSRFAPFFGSLPESFQTGLGFRIAGLKALEGTLVVEEIVQAREMVGSRLSWLRPGFPWDRQPRVEKVFWSTECGISLQHLRSQYDSLFPGLSENYPEVFPENIYTWDQFLWACQLWYSYGMKVKFPNGTIQTCLVPIANLLNHAIYPHVTHFSRINETTNTLQLFALRQCKVGEQCFLSYGALQSSDLLTFYGFLIDDNPYDIIPIDLELKEICDAPQQVFLIEKYGVSSSHMVRGFHCLPTRLIAALRVACMEGEDFIYSADPRIQMISVKNERDVYESLLSTVDSLLEPLQDSDASSGIETGTADTTHWDILLAQQFKRGQRKVLESVRSLCATSLESLE